MSLAADNDLDEIRAGLSASVEGLCAEFFGKPASRTGGDWRYGSHGSLSVVVRGPRRGSWYDHEAGEGGDLLALIRRERGGDFPSTLEWARGFLGIGGREHVAEPPRPKSGERAEATGAEDAAKIERARRLWADGMPIGGTVGEQYLAKTRYISRPPAGWPCSLRFHPGRRALMVAATTADGTVQAVQLVHLTAEAQKRPQEEGRPTKQSFGPQAGAVVRLPGTGGPLLLAEGPETGLSLWSATGRETWIALGGMGKVELPPLRPVALCTDDDPRDSPAAQALRKRLAIWRREGRLIAVATPWSPRRFDRSDFNDLLQAAGPQAVQARILAALAPSPNQPPGAKALPVAEARLRLQETVGAFFKAAEEHDPEEPGTLPPVQGIRVDVGAGKSVAARREAARLLAALRARKDRRKVAFAIPTHALGAEAAEAFNALPEARAARLRAAVWRGREAQDPQQPGKAMCHDLAAVRDAQSVGAPVERHVCRDRDRQVACPLFSVCGYMRQKREKADVWFVPHEILFGSKPAAIGKLAALIVDETAWPDGLEGVNGPPLELSADSFHNDVDVPNDADGSARLREVHRFFREALVTHPLGPLSRKHLLAAGLNADTGHDGHELSWKRLTMPDIYPGMQPEDRREALAGFTGNKTTMRAAGIFKALKALLGKGGPEFSGWLSLAEKQTEDGTVRVIRRRGRREVAKGWLAPTLLIDATLSPELARFHWPRMEMVADIRVRTPHMRVRQLVGRDFTKSALVPDERARPAENDRRRRNSETLRAAILREVRATCGRVLVVAQKAVEDHWRSLGPLPANMELAHHNAVAGRDEWKDVAKLIVVGRTLPRVTDVERIAGALTGRAVEQAAARYDRRDAAVQLEDGTFAAAEADHHPDPTAEAIRWQICEGELIQIIGRGRGVARTSADPLEVQIWTDRPLPLEVAETFAWEEMAPSPADLMMAAGGVALENAADAALAYPKLWPSPAAARQAFHRGRSVTAPNREIPIGECHTPLARATYRKDKAGAKPATLTFDPSMVPDLRAWLEQRLGKLALLKVEEPPEPDPDPPRPGGGVGGRDPEAEVRPHAPTPGAAELETELRPRGENPSQATEPIRSGPGIVRDNRAYHAPLAGTGLETH